MRYFDYVKRSVPMHDDLYDFFLTELPGYDMVGYRETNLVNWGSFDDPDYVDYSYENMTEWGRKRYITPGIAIDGELITTDLVEINLAIRILLGSSYFDSWENERDVRRRRTRSGTRSTRTIPGTRSRCRSRRSATSRTSTRGSCRRASTTSAPTRTCAATPAAARSRASGARRRPASWTSATRRPPAHSIQMALPRSAELARRWRWSGRCPEKSNAIERDRARTYHQAYSALIALHNLERAMKEVQAGRTKSWNDFKVPEHGRQRAASTRPRAACSRTTW